MRKLWEIKTPWTCRARVAWAPQPPTLCCLPRSPSALPEALGADARVAIGRVHTLGPVAAPVGGAVIIVHLAELPAVARGAFAPATCQSEAAPGPASFQAASPVSSCVLKAPQPPRAPQSPAHSLRVGVCLFYTGTLGTSSMKTVVDPT